MMVAKRESWTGESSRPVSLSLLSLPYATPYLKLCSNCATTTRFLPIGRALQQVERKSNASGTGSKICRNGWQQDKVLHLNNNRSLYQKKTTAKRAWRLNRLSFFPPLRHNGHLASDLYPMPLPMRVKAVKRHLFSISMVVVETRTTRKR
ncbi:hypothetical protein OUZ56_004398 [Daphnia magna]|uniref:Uncharacterized protein n=1 Tax=Daphnia magna TaxID=35525 RepID=A0ABQ9YPN2_9CRUS|nr:hypothetical protein OUZ56_004398 [Daphnia magna]